MTRAVITGGAGFIGSSLVRQAVLAYDEVVVLDNLVNGRKENIEEVLQENDGVSFYQLDIRDSRSYGALLLPGDHLFHLACLGVRHSIHSPQENLEVNSAGTLKLLEAARMASVSKVVYVSSSEIYGPAKYTPMDEGHPCEPMTVYGAGKLAGELIAKAYYRTYGLPTVIVRPFNSFGPRSHHEGDSGEVIPKFVLRALAGYDLNVFGDGSQTRDFTYVDDTAAGILLAGRADIPPDTVFNLGSGREIKIAELAGIIIELTGSKSQVKYLPDRPGDVSRLYSNSDSAGERLSFKPEVGLREGLQRLIGWYRENGTVPEDALSQEVICNWSGS